MEVIEGLMTQSGQLRQAAYLSDQSYDRQIRENVASLRHVMSAKSLGAFASNDSLLDVSKTSGISSKLTYKDYLQYFLCGGMVYMALKQWCKAAHFLGIVISMPTVGPISMIMVEAYKKWILVSLLEKGKLSSPSNLVPPHVVKIYHSLAKPYVSLAHSFQRGDLKHLEAEVDAARDIWCTDNNMGLVSQVLGAYSKHTVLGIKQTFAALTVKELADQASPMRMSDEATESVIASLIMRGAVKATLVQHSSQSSSTMLRFSEARSVTQLSNESKTQTCLAWERQSLGTLMGHLDEISHHMELSDEFVDGMQKSQAWSGTGDVNPGIGEDAALEIDEDLMGEVS
ncbi:hypothetical protein PoHVEF18_010699 [Penicillium ochrochloron]